MVLPFLWILLNGNSPNCDILGILRFSSLTIVKTHRD